MKRYFIDFEANGAPLQEIISVGIVSEDKEFSVYTLVKPSHPLDKYIQKITHLTDEEFAGAPSPHAVFSFLYNALKRDVGSNFIWDKCEFYVYGDGDIHFIQETMKMITDPEIYGFLAGLTLNIKDFSKNTTRYFQTPHSLLYSVNYFRKDDIAEEKHHAFYDALLLLELYQNLPKKGTIGATINQIVSIDPKTNKKVIYEDLKKAAKTLAKDMSNTVKLENVQKKIKNAIINQCRYCKLRWERYAG